MKFFIMLITLSVVSASCSVYANQVSWKERGNTVSATAVSTPITSALDLNGVAAKSSTIVEDKPTITLATGQTATLTGGVFVQTTDVSTALSWATENGHIASEDQYSSDVVHIESSPEESMAIANAVAEVPGVSTAAPNYSVPNVKR